MRFPACVGLRPNSFSHILLRKLWCRYIFIMFISFVPFPKLLLYSPRRRTNVMHHRVPGDVPFLFPSIHSILPITYFHSILSNANVRWSEDRDEKTTRRKKTRTLCPWAWKSLSNSRPLTNPFDASFLTNYYWWWSRWEENKRRNESDRAFGLAFFLSPFAIRSMDSRQRHFSSCCSFVQISPVKTPPKWRDGSLIPWEQWRAQREREDEEPVSDDGIDRIRDYRIRDYKTPGWSDRTNDSQLSIRRGKASFSRSLFYANVYIKAVQCYVGPTGCEFRYWFQGEYLLNLKSLVSFCFFLFCLLSHPLVLTSTWNDTTSTRPSFPFWRYFFVFLLLHLLLFALLSTAPIFFPKYTLPVGLITILYQLTASSDLGTSSLPSCFFSTPSLPSDSHHLVPKIFTVSVRWRELYPTEHWVQRR